VSAARVLLAEWLDAAGSDVADARERAAALRAAGAVVRAVALDPDRDGGPPAVATGIEHWRLERDTWPRLREFARSGRFDRLLIAAASDGGGRVAEALAGIAPLQWWPTGWSAAPGWREQLPWRAAPAQPLADHDASGGDPLDRRFSWCSVDGERFSRGRLSIWDGDYVLAPLPLAGEDGLRLLRGFAGVAAESSGLDLVVLSDAQPRFEAEARRLSIGIRVHFVGRAARDAEWAWWAHASAGVLSGSGALAGGLILRALAAGCPLLPASGAGPVRSAGAWLAGQDLAQAGVPASADDLGSRLAQLVDRGPAVEAIRMRGRALAARLDAKTLPDRLAKALPGLAPIPVAARAHRRRAAAA
jgi:glycosyltransferase involved in cell wall biosynthesis